MKTKDTLKAIQEFEMIDDLICFKEEVKSFNGKILNINNETYCIDNVEELKRFYINEICSKHKYTNDIITNINSFEYRVEDFIESLYSHLISQNLIGIISTAITSDIVLENFKYK
jgi:hypothetical protein